LREEGRKERARISLILDENEIPLEVGAFIPEQAKKEPVVFFDYPRQRQGDQQRSNAKYLVFPCATPQASFRLTTTATLDPL
jgi:hypothetical protein